MSFSKEQKKFIIEQPIKGSCCKRAFLEGILAGRGRLCDDGEIAVVCESVELAEHISSLILEIFSKKTDVLNGKSGGRIKLVSFRSPSAYRYLCSYLDGSVDFTCKCQSCLMHFLRGLFLVCGRVSDPSKQYSLDFSARGRTERLSSLFCELGIEPKIAIKANEELVYFRKSSDIEDFFALASMNNAVFALMNAKIQGEFRNNANRVANCEMNNIEKAVNSSGRQLSLIMELDRRGLISQLPDELEQTARLRMQHDDMSLSQLASLFSPTISKSGLSHRLKKINEIALALLGEE